MIGHPLSPEHFLVDRRGLADMLADPRYSGCHVVSVHEAGRLIERWARTDRDAARSIYGRCTDRLDIRLLDDRRVMQGLIELLGHPTAHSADLPRMARMYVLKRPLRPVPIQLIPPEAPAPKPTGSKNTGWVVVEAFTPEELPLPGLKLDVVTSDQRAHTVMIGESGGVRLSGIPQGDCKIRVLGLDGDAWYPADGASAVVVGQGESRIHKVRKGESVARVAQQYGIRGWKKLWEAPENEPLRKKRKNPNVIYPGDEIVVPGVDVCALERPINQVHRIIVSDATIDVKIRLRDRIETGLKDLEYEVSYSHLGKLVTRPGAAKTGADGIIQETVPVGTEVIVIKVKRPRLTLSFLIDELDPMRDEDSKKPIPSGLHARLDALGYHDHGHQREWESREDYSHGSYVTLAWFQQDHLGREQADGLLDDETSDKLEEMYGV
jgi:hypothetical protein